MSKEWIAVLLVASIFTLFGWWEIASWKECRQTNSWWYCVRILSK